MKVKRFFICVGLYLLCGGCAVEKADRTQTHSVALSARTIAAMTDADGWASHEGLVTGGSAAQPQHVYHVKNRAQLVDALAIGGSGVSNTPKLIIISGEIDLSTDAKNQPLAETDFSDPAFSWDAYTAAYNVATWGKQAPTGPIEEARKRSAKQQANVIVIPVGSNTSLIGINGAVLKNGNLHVRDSENVVIRNITFVDAYDYFPAWDPKDNANGEWNAEYDNITLMSARRVWIDHCTFTDGARPDRLNRNLLGRPMQFHDGLVDVVRGSDLITISFNHFKDHDKGMLIGNSDSRDSDAGKLRVTMHHNFFENVKERAPRVRYGLVHLYNNFYAATPQANYAYNYSIGVGYQSKIIAQRNAFDIGANPAHHPFKWWKGDKIEASENLRKLDDTWKPLDVHALLALQAKQPLQGDVQWQVPYQFTMSAAQAVPVLVKAQAGAGRLQFNH